jgi:hypothetical protein
LVIWLADQVLRHVTANAVTAERWAGYLFDRYTSDSTYVVSIDQLEQAMTYLSGHDFGPFYDAYVLGTARLPLDVQNGELIVLWDQLPPMP